MASEYRGLQEAAASLLGVDLTPKQLEAFAWYSEELIDWNRRFNLTAITDPVQVEIKHFLDSLTCLRALGSQPSGLVVDVGAGAGFPGLPLKIVCPQLGMHLVESIGKKVEFCKHMILKLGLEGVEVVHERVERVGHWPEYRASFDWALARAVAPLPVLVEYLLPLLKLGGRAVAQKGETAHTEVHEAERALRLLGGHLTQVIPVELPGVAERRHLVVVEKIAGTPAKYPRRPGIPTKRALR